MHFCFIVEEQYRGESMPGVVANQLIQWGHSVDVLEPHMMVTSLSDLASPGYDAYILKTVSDGPGLSILDAAEAIGIPTINSSHAIHLVRNKAVAAAFAWAHGLPIPRTYFVAHPRLLKQIPIEQYPLVIKPSNGSSCRNVYRLFEPADLAAMEVELARTNERFFLAQQYVENAGYDIKLYVTGKEIDAVARKSPFHGEIQEGLLPLTPALRQLSLDVGRIFGLDIFGLDVVETPRGLALLDINDFPSFRMVPGATIRIAQYILRTAKRARLQRESFPIRQRPHRSMLRNQSELRLRSS